MDEVDGFMAIALAVLFLSVYVLLVTVATKLASRSYKITQRPIENPFEYPLDRDSHIVPEPKTTHESEAWPVIEVFPACCYICENCGLRNFVELIAIGEHYYTDEALNAVCKRLIPGYHFCDDRNLYLYPKVATCQHCKNFVVLRSPAEREDSQTLE